MGHLSVRSNFLISTLKTVSSLLPTLLHILDLSNFQFNYRFKVSNEFQMKLQRCPNAIKTQNRFITRI